MATVDLRALQQRAQLQNRFDAKYVVRSDIAQSIIEINARVLRVLEHEGMRNSTYGSRYFDSPDLASYRAHTQGRRLRFKVRTRHYGRPSEGFLEVKLKGVRAMTRKMRWSRDTSKIGASLGLDDESIVGRELAIQYGLLPSWTWCQSLETSFTRATLLHDSGDRITIDECVILGHDGRAIAANPDYAIVEVKSATSSGETRRMMTASGQRSMSVSKYCIGIAAIHNDVRSNVWRPQLRLLLG
ncbi:MAG: VTC domain-containing protein [bacterium]